MNNKNIYLDWASTSKPNTNAINTANKIYFENFANPSSVHKLGSEVKRVLKNSRNEIASCLGAEVSQIYFTSGGTESNHIPLMSILQKPNFTNCSIAISSLEHNAVKQQAEVLKKLGVEVLSIPSDNNGLITPENVINTIKDNTILISVMMVNNETGAIQPISEISDALHKYAKRHIHFHTDAVQAAGKLKIDVKQLGVDSLAIAGHKIGAARGIGALYLKNKIYPLNLGGGQENNIRPGTENIAGIISMAMCLKECSENIDKNLVYTNNLMNFLITELKKINGITIIPTARTGMEQNFSPYILQFAVEKITGEILVRCLSDQNIFISTGSACSSKKASRPVLEAMKIPIHLQRNAVRVSIGNKTTIEEIDIFLLELKQILNMF